MSAFYFSRAFCSRVFAHMPRLPGEAGDALFVHSLWKCGWRKKIKMGGWGMVGVGAVCEGYAVAVGWPCRGSEGVVSGAFSMFAARSSGLDRLEGLERVELGRL